MRKWRNCTFLHSTVLTQEQSIYIGVKVEGPFKGDTTVFQMQDSFEGVVAGSVFDSAQRWRKIAEVVNLGELFADCSSAGRPLREISISKNYLKSSSIEKN